MDRPTPRVVRTTPTITEFEDLREDVAAIAVGVEALNDMVAELAGDIDMAFAIRDQHLVRLLEAVFGPASVEGQELPPEPEDDSRPPTPEEVEAQIAAALEDEPDPVHAPYGDED